MAFEGSKVDTYSRVGLRFLARTFSDSAKAACGTRVALFVAALDLGLRGLANWQAGHIIRAIPEDLAALQLVVLSAATLNVAGNPSVFEDLKIFQKHACNPLEGGVVSLSSRYRRTSVDAKSPATKVCPSRISAGRGSLSL